VAYAAALAGRAHLETPTLLGYDDAEGWLPQDAVTLDREAKRLWLQLAPRHDGVHLVGHSYGGAVALAMARWWPQKVLSLTLYEPAAFALLRCDADGGPYREVHGVGSEVALWARVGQPERAAERFIDYWGGASSWAHMAPRRREAVALRMAKVSKEFEALFGDPTPAGALSLLAMPVRVLCGTTSPLPARRVSQLVASLCPRAELRVLPGLGHMGPVEQPEVVLPLLPWGTGHRAPAAAHVSGL
jgi:pimeloyl-ACP methyl ester carboxylesterase